MSISPCFGKTFFITCSCVAASMSVMASDTNEMLYARSYAARAVASTPLLVEVSPGHTELALCVDAEGGASNGGDRPRRADGAVVSGGVYAGNR